MSYEVAPDSLRPLVQSIILFLQYDSGRNLCSRVFTHWKESVSTQIWSDGLVLQRRGTRPDILHSSFPSIADRNLLQCHRNRCSTQYFPFSLHTYTHLTSIFSLPPPSSQSPSSHLADKWFNPSHPSHQCDIIQRCVVFCSTVRRSLAYVMCY